MRAYAFEWNDLEGSFYAGSAVVVAGNVKGAENHLMRKLKRDKLLDSIVMFNSTSPGPYWTKLAKKNTLNQEFFIFAVVSK